MSVGGARAGAGAPSRDTVLLRFAVPNCIRVKLERLAAAGGYERKMGSKAHGRYMLGPVLVDLLSNIAVPESEAERLAREIRELRESRKL